MFSLSPRNALRQGRLVRWLARVTSSRSYVGSSPDAVLRHALTTLVAVLIAAALATPTGAQATPAAHLLPAGGSSPGPHAIVALAYVDTNPAAGIAVGVAASRGLATSHRRVLVSWSLTCSTRAGTTQTSGRWTTRAVAPGFGPEAPASWFTPLMVLPHAVVCVVGVSALALDGSGYLTVSLAENGTLPAE